MDLIVPYSKYIRKQQAGEAIIKKNISLTCMTMIEPATGWFEISEVPMYDIGKVTGGNYEYIDKSYAIVRQLFNTTWLIICPRP